jgi:hypothetical protein
VAEQGIKVVDARRKCSYYIYKTNSLGGSTGFKEVFMTYFTSYNKPFSLKWMSDNILFQNLLLHELLSP